MKTLYTLLFAIIGIIAANANVVRSNNDTIQRLISVFQADSLIKSSVNNQDFHILDVRTADEFKTGFIENAVNIDFFSSTFYSVIDTCCRDKSYLIYCKAGSRSGAAYEQMKIEKFRILYCMDGGIVGWKKAGLPVSMPIITNLNVNKNASDNNFQVYPVYVKDIVTIEMSNENTYKEILVYDSSGKIVYKNNTLSSKTTIPVANLQSGIYFIKLITNKIVCLKKIFKQ